MSEKTNARDNALAALSAQKAQIEDNLMALKKACTTDAERATLTLAYTSAVNQYETALTKAFLVNDAGILQSIEEMKTVQSDIQDAIDNAASIGLILNHIADGVRVGSRIITLMG